MDNLGKQKNFCCFWAENLDFAFFICGLNFKNGSIDANQNRMETSFTVQWCEEEKKGNETFFKTLKKN